MTKEEKAVVFSQVCSVIGFNINPAQAMVLFALNELVDEKGRSVSLADIDETVAPFMAQQPQMQEQPIMQTVQDIDQD